MIFIPTINPANSIRWFKVLHGHLAVHLQVRASLGGGSYGLLTIGLNFDLHIGQPVCGLFGWVFLISVYPLSVFVGWLHSSGHCSAAGS